MRRNTNGKIPGGIFLGVLLEPLCPTGYGQTGLVATLLPEGLRVRVVDSVTGVPFADEPVSFAVLPPVNSASLNTDEPATDPNGYSRTKLTLGTSTGTYTIRATCPGCVAGAREVTFTATARSKKLTCVNGICLAHGRAGRRFDNPFKLWVIDSVTGQPVAGSAVSYEVIGFIDTNTVTQAIPAGTHMSQPVNPTGPYGSLSYLIPGARPGTYIVRSRCESCLDGQEAIARGIAHTYDIGADASGNSAGDPGASGDGCTACCNPVTPILRMQMVTAPNDGVSFTSNDTENLIGLNANVLPVCLNDTTSVTWQVADAPFDFINSGTPAQPAPGPVSSFRVFDVNLPTAAAGRSLPLAYKVTASITHNGITHNSSAKVQQDEIDKCRQEYIDIPIIRQFTPEYMSKIGRNLFAIGRDVVFVGNDAVDCYAHIYPSRAGEASRLISTVHPQLYVTSGYRSPRHNEKVRQRVSGTAPNSTHMYGKGADIAFSNADMRTSSAPRMMRDLWDAASCPMILERNGRPIELLVCDSNGEIRQDYLDALNYDPDGDGIPELFHEAVKLHLGE